MGDKSSSGAEATSTDSLAWYEKDLSDFDLSDEEKEDCPSTNKEGSEVIEGEEETGETCLG